VSEKIVAKGLIDGYFGRVALKTNVHPEVVERLMKMTTVPVGGIYVIHHPPADNNGRDFFKEFRDRNPGMRAYVGYTAFETDSVPSSWVEPCNRMDEIWVPSIFNLETFSKAGIEREKIHVIPHAFDPEKYRPDETTPLVIGKKRGFDFLSIFEWTFRKGWDVLIRAYIEEFSRDEDVRLIIRSYQGGGVIGTDVPPVVDQLTAFIRDMGYDPDDIPDIEFIDRMIPDELMPNLYRAADAFILPTRGEGWGIPFTESMLMEVPVIATKWGGHLQFMNDENSYLIDVDDIVPVSDIQVKDNPIYEGHKWAEPSVRHTRALMRYVFENREEAREKGRAARSYIVNNFSITNVSSKIARRVQSLLARKRSGKAADIAKPKGRHKGRERLRILFQGRPNIFTVPGGDTHVMNRIRVILEDNGFTVDFSQDPNVELGCYDIVHIFNFETQFALNAALQKKPFVVTSMYEDFTRYYTSSMKVVSFFREFARTGNLDRLWENLSSISKSANSGEVPPEFGFPAENAYAVIVNGKSEGYRIAKDYPGATMIEHVTLGIDVKHDDGAINSEIFKEKYGVEDFVLCVGRLESRKNQLMLIHALRDDDIPLVFVNSGSIQPEYEELCMSYPRKGRTIFTGRLSMDMLLSAYKAARVHALPSWYELPGLVTLEAAWHGCNVVAPDWGTLREYLGDLVFYCSPHSPRSIRDAVRKAMSADYREEVRRIISNFRWEGTVERIVSIYEKVIERCMSDGGRDLLERRFMNAQQEISFHKRRGIAYKCIDDRPEEAIKIVEELMRHRKKDPMLRFIAGSAYLMLEDFESAVRKFREVIRLQPCYEIRVYLYLALALMKLGRHSEALPVLEESLRCHPFITEETRSLVHAYMDRANRKSGKPGDPAGPEQGIAGSSDMPISAGEREAGVASA